ncbi:pyrophosphate-energized membrane proton pump 3-like [Hibiscus syriacus]|uniref:pyrophosphate-energized membrane proton pump 3-like n=1 Tax=Hibiscus syriacus TaxID=106335 RepID=UPI001921C9F3|nr:pyrophosphate-energized membrane proton pump 3-like [Hibiscus syriacus]
MILGGTMAQRCKIEDPSGFILFPLVVHSFDLVVSSIGIFSIRGTRDSSVKVPLEDPMTILQRGYSVTIVLAVLTFAGVIYLLKYCHLYFSLLVDSSFRTCFFSEIVAVNSVVALY